MIRRAIWAASIAALAGCAATPAQSTGHDAGSTGGSTGGSRGGAGGSRGGAGGSRTGAGGSRSDAGMDAGTDVPPPLVDAGPLLLIGQSGRRPHAEYVATTGSVPAGSSVYAELYTGKLLNWEHEALVAYLARNYPGSTVEVGLSWKDDRVGAGYCDLSAGCTQNCCAANDDQAPVLPELDIVAGRYDAAIDGFAALLAAHPGLKFLVRLDYEVSPDLFCTRSGDCGPYAAAFAYLAARIRAGPANNVQFVFHPTRGWAQRMYPGAAVTDWIGFSVFNHDVCLPATDGTAVTVNCPSTQMLDTNLAGDLTWALGTARKPVLIAESTVQNSQDDTPATFEDALSRLFAVVQAGPLVKGFTYINMKWTGDWVYGENWTSGAFANTDSRVERDPQVQSTWCARVASAHLAGPSGRLAICGAPPAAPALPPNLDAPVYTVIALATNQCLTIPGTAIDDSGPITQGACSGDGRTRFRIAGSGPVQIFNDATWLCLAADGAAGAQIMQRPCDGSSAQRFVETPVSGSTTDVTLQASNGLCIASTTAGPTLQPCAAGSAQTLRLQLQPF